MGKFNTLRGDAGKDLIIGLGRENRLFGGAESDILLAGGRKNRFNGESGNDLIFSVGKSNNIKAGDGNDLIVAAGESNIIDVGSGFNAVISKGKKNIIKGDRDSASANLFIGGGANNTFEGGSGKNLFVISGQNNHFQAGIGKDLFVFDLLPQGINFINNFNNSQGDKIKISKSVFGSRINTNDFNFNPTNGSLLFGNQQIATLQNVSAFNVDTDLVLV